LLKKTIKAGDGKPIRLKEVVERQINILIKGTTDESAKKVFSALKEFIARPEKLSISIQPDEPKCIVDIQMKSPEEVIQLLNLDVKL